MRCFAPRSGEGLAAKFPLVEAESIDILDKMLRFNPIDRASVDVLLEHSLFIQIRDPAQETRAPSFVTLEFESDSDLDATLLRKYFSKEIRTFHPEVPEM